MDGCGEAAVVSAVPAGIVGAAEQVAVAWAILRVGAAVLCDVCTVYPAAGGGVIGR